MKGGAGHKRKTGAVIFYVQDKGFHLLRRNGALFLLQDGRLAIGIQMQHKMKGGGRMSALDQVKADRAYGFPSGKVVGADFFVFPFLRAVKRAVLPPVYGEGIISAD